jgi:polyphosphate glucokinase
VEVLVVDIGGSHVKFLSTGEPEPRQFDSGEDFTPDTLVARLRELTSACRYDVVSLGYPGRVGPNGPTEEPGNLGSGWVGYDFETALGRPVRVINDAAMQALGAYSGGRMLFLGLGTGLGSALVVDRVVVPLELGRLPYREGETLFDRLGKSGRKRHGIKAWNKAVAQTVNVLREAFAADDVVLGGGQIKHVDPLPEGVRRRGNEDAFTGGFRLWEEEFEHHDRAPSRVWRVLR